MLVNIEITDEQIRGIAEKHIKARINEVLFTGQSIETIIRSCVMEIIHKKINFDINKIDKVELSKDIAKNICNKVFDCGYEDD